MICPRNDAGNRNVITIFPNDGGRWWLSRLITVGVATTTGDRQVMCVGVIDMAEAEITLFSPP